MPRTKVAKTSKRSREASHLRACEKLLDDYLEQIESSGNAHIAKVEQSINLCIIKIPTEILQMKMADVLQIPKLLRFKDLNPKDILSKPKSSTSSNGSTLSGAYSMKVGNPNDEGYLTEDSAQSSYSAVNSWMSAPYTAPTETRGRTPGPLNSARARKQRRSRSACGDNTSKNVALTAGTLTNDRQSRGKLRTPSASRSKAFSADRSIAQLPKEQQSPAAAFLRWPKPGETVLSTCGSPLVPQVYGQEEKTAKCLIPLGNGLIALRAKKMSQIHPDLLQGIDINTLRQLKTLKDNLGMFVSSAERANII